MVELDFGSAGGIAAGLWQLARLIAETKPEIVQGWMYHGDLAALIALALSGRRRHTRLVWSIRCSEVDFNCYGRRSPPGGENLRGTVATAGSGDGEFGRRAAKSLAARLSSAPQRR